MFHGVHCETLPCPLQCQPTYHKLHAGCHWARGQALSVSKSPSLGTQDIIRPKEQQVARLSTHMRRPGQRQCFAPIHTSLAPCTTKKLPARKSTACHVPCQHVPRSLALQQSLLKQTESHFSDGQQESHLPCAQSAHAQGPKPSLQQKSAPVLSAFKLLARGAVILFNQFCGS